MPTVGLLYPGHSAEDDFAALERRLIAAGHAVRLPLVHTSVGEDAHRVDALLDLGGHQRLVEGARAFVGRHRLDALMWACTSGSFVFGWEGARRQADELALETGLPTSSTSFGFVHACQALEIERVAVAASYPREVADRFVEFLGRGGIRVTCLGSRGIVTAAEVGALTRQQVVGLVTAPDRTGAQAVLVPDTALHTLAWIADLEEAVGMPVLTPTRSPSTKGCG